MVYLSLVGFGLLYMALLAWVFRPEYILCGVIKGEKRCGKAKEQPKLFNADELRVLNKIIYNMPVLSEGTPMHMEALKNAGFNSLLPLYKIDIGRHKNLKLLKSELRILKCLERAGYAVNIVINFDGRGKIDTAIRNNKQNFGFGYKDKFYKNFSYNDILIMAASLNFEKSVVKIHQAEFLSSVLMFAVNAFNINKPCFDIINRKNQGIWFDLSGKTLKQGREYYDDFVYKSSVTEGEISINRKRTASYKKGYSIERIAITNLGKRVKEVIFNAFWGLGIAAEDACYVKVMPYKSGVKIVDFKNKTERYISASCGLMHNLKVTKLGIKGQIKLKIRGGCVFYAYILRSNSFVAVENLERGEALFFDAKNEYKNLAPIKVESNNMSFDRLINLLLPQRIIARYINNPELMPNFCDFVNLMYVGKPEYITSLKGIYVKNDNLVGSWFDLLWQFAGISFAPGGIRINPQRKWLLENTTLKFVAEGNAIVLKIKNQKEQEGGFVYNGVEYYNIGFLPYRTLNTNDAVINM